MSRNKIGQSLLYTYAVDALIFGYCYIVSYRVCFLQVMTALSQTVQENLTA